MPRWIYVNGRYALASKASVSFQDRGFQFGDGVYGVLAYYKGRFIDEAHHLAALMFYCQRIQLDLPLQPKALSLILRQVVRRNRLTEGHIYVQITRGEASRIHRFPSVVRPTVVVVGSPWQFSLDAENLPLVKVISRQDIRWRCPDIKTTALLPSVLLREQAHQQGAFEAWLIDEKGKITEGASSNAFIVTSQGVIVTRPADGCVIAGVTRQRLLNMARALGFPVEERPFSLEEAYQASESFLSGATSLIKAVTRVNDQTIGRGQAGPVTKALASHYFNFFRKGDLR